MADWQTRILSLEARLRQADERIANLEAVIDSLEHDNLELIGEVRDLTAELENRRADSWRPHR